MANSFLPTPGAVVTCRNRQWVVLPSENSEVIRLRPLSGNEDQVCGIYQPLELEPIASAQFPAPRPEAVQDHTAAQLLMDAARLSLRSGAGPFRSLGRLSVRPRPYQVVPLLMALRLETIRLLIADDVGIGKTIEAGLTAREMLDRGEVKRLAVLCPPHLCDQWQRELREKFHIDAVVIRSGTVTKLERGLTGGNHHVFGYYRHIIVSLDYAKSDRRRASFLTHCPDLVIVDEAHTCARPGGRSVSQQQRHQLIQEIAQKDTQHLILLSATPHSGIEASFLSILGLLDRRFEAWDINHLSQEQRIELANHFVQRRRADVKRWLGNETPFPERDPQEQPYKLSKDYRDLFEQVYNFARGLVQTTTQDMSHAQRRGRYWAALGLIRCVMSSPEAAIATLSKQVTKTDVETESSIEIDEDLMVAYTYDPTDQEQAIDAQPTIAIEQGQQTYKDSDRRKLRGFIQAAVKLKGAKDVKLQAAIATIEGLLNAGFNPIVWCRYIATANYVAEELRSKFEKKRGNKIRVIPITGELSEDEREVRLEELTTYPARILVATDCLSEGVNLQECFNAVIHYDLPWNPNRLEQREGRIDRYGQTAPLVKSYLLYGQDNPVDGAVLEVLIRKAVEIHKTLGITVPVPMDSATVSEAVFKSLFDRKADAEQLSLLDLLDNEESAVDRVHQNWDRAVEREKVSRTRFAQRAIKPDEVEQELVESDQILGSEADVERFVKAACSRLNTSLQKKKLGWLLPSIPLPLQNSLGTQPRTITFTTPAPEGVEYVGRNHSLVEGLAHYLLEETLENLHNPMADGRSETIAARCGFTITDAVEKRTTLLLLRSRYLLSSPRVETLLAEECFVAGFTGPPSNPLWLEPDESQHLLQKAEPVGDIAPALKRMEIEELIDSLGSLEKELEAIAQARGQSLAQSHRRVRNLTKEGQVRVKPQLPMDVLGLFVLQPGQRRSAE
ncbi:MAG: DEAD/DEAH box helicase [Acaryochloris sp. RU_4_1]|nr:DEAD/DEAH box helicase [Acaryochloris sp. RU_4_1]NJR55037.1 DEAD/DEAH box helicase [Acaryochloris sp. CRU_2_0]